MKKYVIVSTYPETGSKNIGDQLITTALVNLLKFVKGDEISISTVWREQDWDEIKEELNNADAIIFACLAIRKSMHCKEYPYLDKIIELNTPVAVIAAGTSLDVTKSKESAYEDFSKETLLLLEKLDKKCLFFTTRGYLTQAFCERINMNNTHFSGDVAFFDETYGAKKFEPNKIIKKIVISDPHRAKMYLNSFDSLVKGMRELYPTAEITVALHGNEPTIEAYAIREGLKVSKIYENRYEGLRIYDNADLHVGYRVHAHVSALKRRVYSYLLEQDGRGCDYGLTLEKKISVPNYLPSSRFKLLNLADRVMLKFFGFNTCKASTVEVEEMIALIKNDSNYGFIKFNKLEEQICGFSTKLTESIKQLP
ncbi:polysaccharide pyruvyl transferase family protein [Photobacterium sp. SDRW27]|uniref:polysaccharide pyruvyl transferase family protein n=1 Tax=Photobacterium obscurum TaxID=2829490 RepID=UPI0022432180|nr:polysaccharide pyruvyl transferase family protein [Photobacterium obscurum]MCW8328232.1 polysaccharide pyruvyl transferase family protein [Photobacterium obscurum]